MCTLTFVAIVLVWFHDDHLKTPVEVLSILDQKIKSTRKKYYIRQISLTDSITLMILKNSLGGSSLS